MKKLSILPAVILCVLLAFSACGQGGGAPVSSQDTPAPASVGAPPAEVSVAQETPQHIIDFEAEVNEIFDHLCLNGPAVVTVSDEDEYRIMIDFTGDEGVWDKVDIDTSMESMHSMLDSLFMYFQGVKGYTVEELTLPLYSEGEQVGDFRYTILDDEGHCELWMGDDFCSAIYEAPENAVPGAYASAAIPPGGPAAAVRRMVNHWLPKLEEAGV